MTDSGAIQRPRVRAAAIYALVLLAGLYGLRVFFSLGWPFSLLLAPALLGNGLLLGLMSGAGMDIDGGFARGLAWLGGALVSWYLYYKLVYFVLWLFGIHQPIKPGADPDAAPVRDDEGGWIARVLLVAAIPAVLAVMVWHSATRYDHQYERQYDLVLAAAEVACNGDVACDKRVSTRFEACFDEHFVRDGRKWLRAHHALDREPFRACLHGRKPLGA